MQRFDSPLTNIKIASPCSANWDEMSGNDRKRFCGQCSLNVYNLSGMTKYDAENLLAVSEGRVCVRYFQRNDGSVITADCPVGWAKVKQRLSVCTAAAFSLLFAILTGLSAVPFLRGNIESVRRVVLPFAPPVEKPVIMGAIAMPSPSPTPAAVPKKEQKIVIPARPVRKFAE